MFYPVIYLKTILIIIFTVLLHDREKTLGTWIMLLQQFSIGFLATTCPFAPHVKKGKCKFIVNTNSLAIICEWILLAYFFLFFLLNEDSPSFTSMVNYVQISLIFVFSVTACILGSIISFKNLVSYKHDKLSQFDEDELIKEYHLSDDEYEYEEEEEEEEIEEDEESEDEVYKISQKDTGIKVKLERIILNLE